MDKKVKTKFGILKNVKNFLFQEKFSLPSLKKNLSSVILSNILYPSEYKVLTIGKLFFTEALIITSCAFFSIFNNSLSTSFSPICLALKSLQDSMASIDSKSFISTASKISVSTKFVLMVLKFDLQNRICD